MLLLEDGPHFSLSHDPVEACLYAHWWGPHNSRLTRLYYELILGHVRATQSKKLLNDGLSDKDGWHGLVDWLTNEYFIHLANEGIQAVAWVLPKNQQAFWDTFQVVKNLRQPAVDTFTDVEAAYYWLHRQVMTKFN